MSAGDFTFVITSANGPSFGPRKTLLDSQLVTRNVLSLMCTRPSRLPFGNLTTFAFLPFSMSYSSFEPKETHHTLPSTTSSPFGRLRSVPDAYFVAFVPEICQIASVPVGSKPLLPAFIPLSET